MGQTALDSMLGENEPLNSIKTLIEQDIEDHYEPLQIPLTH